MDAATSNTEKANGTAFKKRKVPFYINRNFALLFGGYSISVIGDVIFTTTLTLWVALVVAKDQPWAPMALGGVLIATLIPTLLLGSLAGVFVDRWVKRTTMLRMDAIRAVLILSLLPLANLPGFSLPLPALGKLIIIYLVVFLNATCAQFFNPSSFALVNDIVPNKYRSRATGLEQLVYSLAFIVGPPIAVPLFVGMGAEMAILLNALSFALSFLAVLAIRPPSSTTSLKEGEKGHFLHEYLEGLAFVGKNKVLLIALLGAFLAVIPEGAQNSLGIFFFQANLHAPIELFGLIGAASGIGGISGALLAALFAQKLGITRVFSGGLLIVGALMLIYARTTWLPLALVCIFLVGLLIAAVNVVVGPMAMSVTPKEILGRVAATATSTLSLGSLLSVSILSFLASTLLVNFHVTLGSLTFSTYDTIFAITALIALAGGIFAMMNLWSTHLIVPDDDEDEEQEDDEDGQVLDAVATGRTQSSVDNSTVISHP